MRIVEVRVSPHGLFFPVRKRIGVLLILNGRRLALPTSPFGGTFYAFAVWRRRTGLFQHASGSQGAMDLGFIRSAAVTRVAKAEVVE